MKNKERFIRWQSNLRNQLTFLNNLLLTISIGTIGFMVSLLSEAHFNPVDCQKLFFTFGILLIFLSIVFGLSTAFSRLLDFRTTVRKIKNENKGAGIDVLEDFKELMDVYGKATWFFFYSQVFLLFVGIINLMISFCLIYSDKLF